MDEEKLHSIFIQEEVTTELSCRKAFEISDKYGITKAEIAQYCAEKAIKIRGCQLGCFP
ncbi:MAG: hypothetical protein LUQ07_02130 [Methanospirillum sp.]|nr:hypothetical protein [Methanospirillum sp.]